MWCMKCNHDLAECECPDIMERLRSANDHPNVKLDIERIERERERERKLRENVQ